MCLTILESFLISLSYAPTAVSLVSVDTPLVFLLKAVILN